MLMETILYNTITYYFVKKIPLLQSKLLLACLKTVKNYISYFWHR